MGNKKGLAQAGTRGDDGQNARTFGHTAVDGAQGTTGQIGHEQCGGHQVVDEAHLRETVALFQRAGIQLPVQVGHNRGIVCHRSGDPDAGIGRHRTAGAEKHP